MEDNNGYVSDDMEVDDWPDGYFNTINAEDHPPQQNHQINLGDTSRWYRTERIHRGELMPAIIHPSTRTPAEEDQHWRQDIINYSMEPAIIYDNNHHRR